MTRRLSCTSCLRSDHPTTYSVEFERRLCQNCHLSLSFRRQSDPFAFYRELPNPDDARDAS